MDCGAGYVLVGGACHTPCNDNRVLAGDDCVEVLCATGFTWTGTHCLPDGPACPHGQVIVNGRCTQLGFEDVAGVDLQVRPELLNPELDLSQTIPVLPLFPNN